MERYTSFDGTEIAYQASGQGPPVLLLHGFASTASINWVRTGVVDALTAAGWRVVAPDARGHGASGRPHHPDAYADGAMTRDHQGLLDHLGIDACAVAGYSMGAREALRLALADARVRCLVLGGAGSSLLARSRDPEAMARALEAADRSEITDRTARRFRDFAELTGADRQALAAYQRRRRRPLEGLEELSIPTLVLVGDRDEMAGDPEALAARIPGARVERVGGTHLNTPANPAFHAALVGFLERHWPPAR